MIDMMTTLPHTLQKIDAMKRYNLLSRIGLEFDASDASFQPVERVKTMRDYSVACGDESLWIPMDARVSNELFDNVIESRREGKHQWKTKHYNPWIGSVISAAEKDILPDDVVSRILFTTCGREVMSSLRWPIGMTIIYEQFKPYIKKVEMIETLDAILLAGRAVAGFRKGCLMVW